MLVLQILEKDYKNDIQNYNP